MTAMARVTMKTLVALAAKTAKFPKRLAVLLPLHVRGSFYAGSLVEQRVQYIADGNNADTDNPKKGDEQLRTHNFLQD